MGIFKGTELYKIIKIILHYAKFFLFLRYNFIFINFNFIFIILFFKIYYF